MDKEDAMQAIRTARDLGALIKQERKNRGFSQAALGNEVGVHQPKISALERGAAGVRIGLVLQILRTLDLVVTIGPIDTHATKAPTKGRKKRHEDYVDLDAIANTGIIR
jgi:HTH-type transcriptional regulator/antitoxin HipB